MKSTSIEKLESFITVAGSVIMFVAFVLVALGY